MWILVIFCMIIMIGIWQINLDLNKSDRTNSNNSDNLDIPPFPKLEEKLEELNKEIDSVEKFNEQELEERLFEEDIEETKTNKTGEDLEN